MCQTAFHRHSIFCILPPHILRSIAQNGTPQQRAAAMHTLGADNTLRTLRASVRGLLPAAAQLRARVQVEAQKRRTIYNAHNTNNLPGDMVRSEGAPPSGDVAVDEAYDGLGATFDFYDKIFGRNSIDDKGMPLDASVHFRHEYNNAFWDGERMVFGDGDGEVFNRFTISLDVIGHELTHGVTQAEAELVYSFQSGALNESISDVFGSLIKQYALRQTAAQADWLIGAGLLTNKVHGVALRSMKAPGTAFDDKLLGKDPQPAHMKDFSVTFEDNGGVHINSGIPNHAFYLVATRLGGYAWEKAGRIWYETVRDPRLNPVSGFRQFAGLTCLNAGRLFGKDSAEQRAVHEGWASVGIEVEAEQPVLTA
ncbi:MAG TPA: M4 family metallopeptidase [Noviherbaspirillum sp.]